MMNLKDQRIIRQRTLRMIPILTNQSRGRLVDRLSFDIKVEHLTLRSAPLRVGEHIDLLGISTDKDFLETGIQDMTDVLADKATLEGIIVRVGEQYKCFDMSHAYSRDANFRQLMYSSTTTVNFHKSGTDMAGQLISKLDPFMAAGIQICLDIALFGVINRETGGCTLDATTSNLQVSFPDAKDVPSLAEEEVRSAITRDIKQIFDSNDFEVAGYLLDIDRVNHFEQEPVVKTPTREEVRDAAASVLAARYQEPPLYVPV